MSMMACGWNTNWTMDPGLGSYLRAVTTQTSHSILQPLRLERPITALRSQFGQV